ncbi:MAG: S8 family serine peptidase [Burkholderiales bacterium]|jgi:subtilisin family serine protease
MLRVVAGLSLMMLVNFVQANERLIVKFRESGFAANASAQQVRQEMARPYSQARMESLSDQARLALSYSHPIAQSGAHVLRLPQGSTQAQMQAVIDNLKRLPDIAYVEEDQRMFVMAPTNDTSYNDLWGMLPVNTGTPSYGANFQNAWALTTGSGVVLAVIDTGILPHPDIGSITLGSQTVNGNLVSAGYDFITDCRIAATCAATTASGSAARSPVDNAFDQGDWITSAEAAAGQYFQGCTVRNSSWHGTHVAGTVAAIGNNNEGVVGGAYGARILPVRALGKCGGFTSDVAAAIRWAAGVHGSITNPNPARVINLSLGGSGSCSTTYQEAINAATAAGSIVVVAAGNSNTNVSNAQPASCNNVIAVAATNRAGSRASYSNFGSGIHVAAPGGEGTLASNAILSTLNNGTTTYNPAGFNYVAYQGTSMAAPHVSAAVALLKANISSITTTQARAVLQATVTSFPASSTCTTSTCGAGILNAARVAAVNTSTPPASPTSINFGQLTAGSTSSTQSITITNPNATLSAVFGSPTMTPSANFSVVSNTCATVAPSGTCAVGIRFTATAGLIQGSLALPVTIGGWASTTSVSLTGTSTQRLSVPSSSVTLDSVNTGSNTTSTITFTNNSGNNVTMGAASVTPSNIFAITSDACSNATLANAGTCNVTLRATPTAAGAYSGTLTLNTTGGGDTAVSVTLSGNATTPAPVSSGGGGGGGSTGLLGLLFLLVALVLSRRYPAFR